MLEFRLSTAGSFSSIFLPVMIFFDDLPYSWHIHILVFWFLSRVMSSCCCSSVYLNFYISYFCFLWIYGWCVRYLLLELADFLSLLLSARLSLLSFGFYMAWRSSPLSCCRAKLQWLLLDDLLQLRIVLAEGIVLFLDALVELLQGLIFHLIIIPIGLVSPALGQPSTDDRDILLQSPDSILEIVPDLGLPLQFHQQLLLLIPQLFILQVESLIAEPIFLALCHQLVIFILQFCDGAGVLLHNILHATHLCIKKGVLSAAVGAALLVGVISIGARRSRSC